LLLPDREGHVKASDIIALIALVVSIATAIYASWWKERAANVGADFYWLPHLAEILLPSGETVEVGYHLVLHNRGPHRASNVNVKFYRFDKASGRTEVVLAAIEPAELPLEVLDIGVKYPIPWALGETGTDFRKERRFDVEMEWSDGRCRRQKRRIALREGNIGNIGLP
jgi:hypothetical protein